MVPNHTYLDQFLDEVADMSRWEVMFDDSPGDEEYYYNFIQYIDPHDIEKGLLLSFESLLDFPLKTEEITIAHLRLLSKIQTEEIKILKLSFNIVAKSYLPSLSEVVSIFHFATEISFIATATEDTEFKLHVDLSSVCEVSKENLSEISFHGVNFSSDSNFNSLNHLTNLLTISFTWTNIYELSFKLENLRLNSILFQHNTGTGFWTDIILDLPNLEHISVSDDYLLNPKMKLGKLSQLKSISFTKTNLDAEILVAMTGNHLYDDVESFSCSYSNLKNLDFRLFHSFPNLKKLRLFNCPIAIVDGDLSKLRNLEKLILRNDKSFEGSVIQFSKKIIVMPKLKIIDLTNSILNQDVIDRLVSLARISNVKLIIA